MTALVATDARARVLVATPRDHAECCQRHERENTRTEGLSSRERVPRDRSKHDDGHGRDDGWRSSLVVDLHDLTVAGWRWHPVRGAS